MGKTKKIMGIIIALLVILGVIHFGIGSILYDLRIRNTPIDGDVIQMVKIKSSYKIYFQKPGGNKSGLNIEEIISFGSTNFIWSDSFHIDADDVSSQITVGDRMIKSANSLQLNVFRKNTNHQFVLHKTFYGGY